MKPKKKYDVFISYRRDGGQVTARILRDTLTERGYNVFFDVESLRSGAFNTQLYSVIEECTDFILVLSPNALDRCVHPDDWVRNEIEHAFRKKKNIIPVLLRGFDFPGNLPETLSELPYQNGLAANLEYYDAFVDKLETFLQVKKKTGRRIAEWFRSVKKLPVILTAAAIAAGCIFGVSWLGKYPRTEEQINLTHGVIANISYNISCLDVLIDGQRELLAAADDYLFTKEADICADRFAVCANTFSKSDITMAKPDEALLRQMMKSPFNPEELRTMHAMVASFQQDCVETMAYMEFIVSEECMLSESEKLRTVQLYEDYLNEMVEWFAYCTNEMLLPVTREQYLDSFWQGTLPYMGEIPLSKNSWSRDKEALVEAGDECYENMQDIQAKLGIILGNTTMALRQQQAEIRRELTDAGYTEARAKKIVSYIGHDWEEEFAQSYVRKGYSETDAAAQAKEDAGKREWELDAILSLSGKTTDDVNTLWEKMTYLLDLELYEEAEECIGLYQIGMTNSDRYMPGLVLFMQMKQQKILEHGIMVMEYYEEDGVNDQLMIGDIIYRFNGADCKTVAEYLSAKKALSSESYTVKLLRMDENRKPQVLELILEADSPRVYLNDLLPAEEG